MFFELNCQSPIVDRQNMLLSLEGEPVSSVPVSVDCYVINPMSTHMDLAISYVEACVAQYTPEQKLQLYPAYTEPVRYEGYNEFIREWTAEKEALEAQLAAAGEKDRVKYQKELDEHMEYLLEGPDEYYTSPEDIAFYKKEIAPYLFIPDIAASRLLFSGDEPFWTVIDNLLEGRLTDDQFIAELSSLCRAAETAAP